MIITDLSQRIESHMPVVPGNPTVFVRANHRVSDHGYADTNLEIHSHTGTHVDVPAHMKTDGNTLDMMAPDRFMGSAFCLDCRHLTNGEEIGVLDLLPYSSQIRNHLFLLICTGWSRHWGSTDYFTGFSGLSKEAAIWLDNFELSGVGIDAISIEAIDKGSFPVHHILFENNRVIYENLCRLEFLIDKSFTFVGLPLRLADGDGSPVRAVAITE